MVVCFLAAALGAVSGMGGGMLVTLFITPIVGAKAVLPILSVYMLINNGTRVWFYREALVWKHALLIGGIAIPASALGALVYVRLEGEAIQIMLGAILIASIPLRRWMEGRELRPGKGTVIAVSGAFGFLTSIIVGAGMLIIPILMGLGHLGPALLATDAAIAVMVNIAKIIFYGGLDALTLPMTGLALAMGLCAIPGTWLGVWVVRHTSIRVHTLMVEALILVGGGSMIWRAL
nr:sulfite exporter TauE/SafE family protein [Halovulum dunhuangense]